MEFHIGTKLVLYIIIICFFGYIIGSYFATVREGARTLPRPVINPITKEEILDIKPLAPYHGETLNKMIDRYISLYFDKRGFPYTGTITLYSKLCIDGNIGVTTKHNKRRLTDIGYYLLNIVIPNIQTIDNPTPIIAWPAIKWTGDKFFNVQVQPTATYKIYKGQAWAPNGGGDMNDTASTSGDGGDGGDGGGETPAEPTPTSTPTDDPEPADKGCGGDNYCRIACPGSCLDSVASAWKAADDLKAEINKSAPSSESNSSSFGWGFGSVTNNTSIIPGVSSLTGGSNTMIIGNTEVDGYQITDETVDANVTELNDNVNAFINDYFIESGVNKGKPTQKAIDAFNMYFEYKTPMDGIHMNKMRDVVYYILQSIIPGLPTSDAPKAYVEWRPIHWLSRSEKK